MTAAEMIAALSKLPADTELYVPDTGCGCCSSCDAFPASLEEEEKGFWAGAEYKMRKVWVVA